MANHFPIMNITRKNTMHNVIRYKADRSFILLGRVAQGKSALANLVVGCRPGKEFPTHNPKQAYSITKEVNKGKTRVALDASDEVVIEILDQCGLNDGNITLEKHKNNIIKCILNANARMNVNYLVVIDLSRKYYDYEQHYMIAAINTWLTNESYIFAENALIVFTHKDVLLEEFRILCEFCYPKEELITTPLCTDCQKSSRLILNVSSNLISTNECEQCKSQALIEKGFARRADDKGQGCQTKCCKCDDGSNHRAIITLKCKWCTENKLNSILEEKRKTKQWKFINETLKLIPNYIIIDALNVGERIQVLKELMHLTTPTLKILFHGNADFSSDMIKKKIKNKENPINHKGYNLEFYFNPDYLPYLPPNEQLAMEEQIVHQMKDDLKLVNALSVIMIQINLNAILGNASNKFILSINNGYEGFDTEQDWWKYAVLIFHMNGSNKNSTDANRIIGKNGELKNLMKSVNDRCVIVDDATSSEAFLDGVIKQSLKVKQLNRGKDFVNREVVNKMIVHVFGEIEKSIERVEEKGFLEEVEAKKSYKKLA